MNLRLCEWASFRFAISDDGVMTTLGTAGVSVVEVMPVEKLTSLVLFYRVGIKRGLRGDTKTLCETHTTMVRHGR